MDKVERAGLGGEGDGAQTAAERVFSILELFEMIFDFVDSVDIIRCRGVSKCIYESISASRALRERLCLRPIASAGSARHVPVSPNPVKMDTSHACGLTCPHVAGSVELSALKPTKGSPKMWEQMYISQPPIKVVRISYLNGFNELISGFPPPCASSAHVESPPAANVHRIMPVMGSCISCQKQIFVPLGGLRFCFYCRRRMVTQVVQSEEGIQFGHLLREMDGRIETIKKAGGNVGSGGLISFAGPFTEADNHSGSGLLAKEGSIMMRSST
ncbi:hypothetical protein LTR10_012122 [Elasticomyces elasticus]|nr:hypothetical protein LTR10_012122 [Elasticomyces elasticus]KAK4969062.1 hypothetical protein LTR42_009341 [Elasticomyces elasticus]